MELSDFRILIRAYTDSAGEVYLTDDDEVLALINRVLKSYARDTLCLYSDDIGWTLTPDVATYSLRDTTAFARPVCHPLRVWINGNLINQVATSADMATVVPGYDTATSGTPSLWFTQPPHHIRLYQAPSSAFSDSRVAGWYLPTALVDEDDSVDLPDEALESAAVECAISLLAPRATGDLLERVNYLRQANEVAKATIRKASDRLLAPVHIRRSSGRVYRLG